MQESAGPSASERSVVSVAREPPVNSAAPISQRHLESGRLSAFIDEEAVTALMDMGFDRASSLSALQHCGGVVERAADMLLSET